MAFCSNCGNKLIDGAKFCDKCGTAVNSEKNEIKCKHDYICKKCGANLALQKDFFPIDWEYYECYGCGEILYNVKYICISCGATLNIQKGFHPQKEMHICASCGEKNYGYDIHGGDRFEGIYWYCDKCNALLNKQKGFNDRFDFWFCSECGYKNEISENNIISDEEQHLKENAKETNTKETERKTVYQGAIHKCPSCGEQLNSFSVSCPYCGYEFRELKNSKIIEQFSQKINACSNDSQIINIIRTCPIPNSKEDLFEFLIIAKSNILLCDKNGDGILSYDEMELLNAWLVKIEQCHEKSQLTLNGTSDLQLFENKYRETLETLNKIKEEDKKNKKERNNEIKSNKIRDDFKKEKKAKIAGICGLIFSVFFTLIAFAGEHSDSGFIGILMFTCFILFFLIGNQIVKIRIEKIYFAPLIIGFCLVVPFFSLF